MGGGAGVTPPRSNAPTNPNAAMWLRFAGHLANGPGGSGLLAGAYINQMRQLRQSPQTASVEIINLRDVDDALAAALDEEEASRARPRS